MLNCYTLFTLLYFYLLYLLTDVGGNKVELTMKVGPTEVRLQFSISRMQNSMIV